MMFSMSQNPSACKSIILWLLSQQNQITGNCVSITYTYLHVNPQNPQQIIKKYDISMRIPTYNKSFKMKCLYGNIYIKPLSLDGLNLNGFDVYCYKRGIRHLWFVNKDKINMLDYFLSDILKTEREIFVPMYSPVRSPTVINGDAIGKFEFCPEFHDLMIDTEKITNSDAFSRIRLGEIKKVPIIINGNIYANVNQMGNTENIMDKPLSKSVDVKLPALLIPEKSDPIADKGAKKDADSDKQRLLNEKNEYDETF